MLNIPLCIAVHNSIMNMSSSTNSSVMNSYSRNTLKHNVLRRKDFIRGIHDKISNDKIFNNKSTMGIWKEVMTCDSVSKKLINIMLIEEMYVKFENFYLKMNGDIMQLTEESFNELYDYLLNFSDN